MELLQYTFFQNALLGSLFTAIVCGVVGTYVVSRRLVFISGGITHASFGGLGLGFYLGMNPILTAMAFAVLSAFGVEWMSKSQQIREDSAIAGIWSLGMALGVIFTFLTPGFAPNLSAYLFGNILTITQADIIASAALAVLLLLLFFLFGREILYVAFDANFARTQGLPVRFIEYVMMCFIAIAIVLSIRMVPNHGESTHVGLSQDPMGQYSIGICRVGRGIISLLLPKCPIGRLYNSPACRFLPCGQMYPGNPTAKIPCECLLILSFIYIRTCKT